MPEGRGRPQRRSTALRGNPGHRRQPVPPAGTVEWESDPEGLEQWLRASGRWWPFSAELLETFQALCIARQKATAATTLVKLSDGMRRVLRDMGALDAAPK